MTAIAIIQIICATITAVCNLLSTVEGQAWLRQIREDRQAWLAWWQHITWGEVAANWDAFWQGAGADLPGLKLPEVRPETRK